MRRYDVVIIMEVVDAQLKAPYQLLEALNNGAKTEDIYNLEISDRLGRTTYKEQ